MDLSCMRVVRIILESCEGSEGNVSVARGQ